MYRFALILAALSLLLAQPSNGIAQQPQRGVALPPSQSLAASAGRYYALIIGINDYASLNKLTTAVLDARSLDAELRDGYHFNTVLLEDSKATRSAILRALVQYRTTLGPNDNLLIYFAGHGLNDKAEGRAYWLPYDYDGAGSGISGEDLAANIRAMPARHVLVISDSCYAGDLVRAPMIAVDSADHSALMERLQAMKSRTFIASGGDEPVSDGGGDGHSVFTAAVLHGLKDLEGNAFSAGDLFQWHVQQRVAGQARQTPKFAMMNASGHEDGDFVFLAGNAKRAPAPAQPPTVKADPVTEAWELIRNSQRPEDFDEFAAAFPNSDLATTAKFRAGTLRRASSRPAPGAPALRAGQTKQGKDGLTYVWIPPGTFTMGCSRGDNECNGNEKPAHPVTVTKGFWMGQTPVTHAAYQRIVGTRPSYFEGDGELPVEQVSLDDAKVYCSKFDMRLPTEAEWEYAARAGSTAARYGALDDIGWYQGNSGGKTHPVAQKQPNAWNLYDLLGNVYQWTADWYGETYYQRSQPSDPQGPTGGDFGVIRGGSWHSVPLHPRASYREPLARGNRGSVIGFRCVEE